MINKTADADEIATTIIPGNAPGDHADDLDVDDQRWIEIVTASLEGRSCAARQALAKALRDDEDAVTGVGPVSGLEPDRRETEGGGLLPTGLLPTHPVSGTTSPSPAGSA